MRNERPNLCSLFVLTVFHHYEFEGMDNLRWRKFYFTCCPSRNYINRAIVGTNCELLQIPSANIVLGKEIPCGNGFTVLLERMEDCLYLAAGPSAVRES